MFQGYLLSWVMRNILAILFLLKLLLLKTHASSGLKYKASLQASPSSCSGKVAANLQSFGP